MTYDPDKFQRKYGTRSEVYDLKTCYMTRGGLTAEDLTLSRSGKIVSKKKQESARLAYKEFGFAKWVKPIKEEEPEEPKKKRRRVRKKKVKAKNEE